MKKHLPYVLIAAAALALDQISKYLIEAFIPLGGTISIIDGFFDLTYAIPGLPGACSRAAA